MPTKGNVQAILVDEFIFNAETSGITSSISISELDHVNLASTAAEYQPGLGDWRITQNGYFAGGDADGMADELHDRLGTTGVQLAHLLDRTTGGSRVLVVPSAYGAGITIEAQAPELITMNGDWTATEAGKGAYLVSYNVSITATGTKSAVDFGSAGSGGGTAFLHVHSIDGDLSGTSTDSIITLESSTTEGGTYATEASFTFSATGGFQETMSGTVNRWLRINTTDLGGATTIVATVYAYVSGV